MELYNSFYRGYVRSKNKTPMDSFKSGSKLLTLDQVKDEPEYAGVMANDSVLIDVDDMEQSEILLKIVEDHELLCRVYQSRSGMHFLFKNRNNAFSGCKNKTSLACGLKDIDIKSGLKNSVEVLKIEGKEREILYDILDGEEYQDVPAFLYPVHSNVDFFGMEEGDGRDSALYGYILNLQSAGLSKDEAIQTIKIINKYILKDPMSDADIDRITRDEAFLKQIFFEKGMFLFDAFAQFMVSEHHIKRINGQLHMYVDGIYVAGYQMIETAMIKHIPKLNDAKRREVLKYMELIVDHETPTAPAEWIAFKNGVYNVMTQEFCEFSPDVIITNRIPWDYNSEAYDESVDQVLDRISCDDKNIRNLLEEMIGACFYRSNNLAGGRGFILTGDGSNGKSTYINMVKNVLGNRNTTSLDIKKFDDRFSTVMIVGKLAVLSDDISDEFMSDTSTFKKVITGESISAEQKGQPKFDFEPYCKVICSANNIGRLGRGKDSFAIVRRLVIIPFNAIFSKYLEDGSENPNYSPFIGQKLRTQSAAEYLIQLGIQGLLRVLETNEYSTSQAVANELKEFEESNNPVIGFFNETDPDEIANQITKDVYLAYTMYCSENGLTAIGSREFTKQVKKHFGFEVVETTIDKRKRKIFARKGKKA